LDYLRRDSLCTGAGYGHFDWFRLLTTVEFYGDDMDLIWPEKAALAIEEYVFARLYMYQNVYHHKTTRGFEQILQAMWRRAAHLRQTGVDVCSVPVLKEFWNVINPTPETLPLAKYFDIEEFTVLSQIQAWTSHKDKPLADLAQRFLARDGFAMIAPPEPANPLETAGDADWFRAIAEVVGKFGFEESTCYCLVDDLEGKYRRPYKPEKESAQQTASTAIRVRVSDRNKPIEISEFLPRLGAVTSMPPARRLFYVPKETREAVLKLRREWKPAAGPLFQKTPHSPSAIPSSVVGTERGV
jgi:HD superfamily phosphohydrolase